jgi:hypothetical protein
MKQITQSEWRALHRDYKLIVREGDDSRLAPGRYKLEFVTGVGTCLVPVEVVKDGA